MRELVFERLVTLEERGRKSEDEVWYPHRDSLFQLAATWRELYPIPYKIHFKKPLEQ